MRIIDRNRDLERTQGRQRSRREVLKAAGSAAAAALVGCQEFGSAPKRRRTIVESHVHIWVNDPAYPWGDMFQKRIERGEWAPPVDATAEQLSQVLERNGVHKAVIVHPYWYLWDCRYTGEVIRANPSKYMGVCRVDPRSPQAPDDLTRWVEEYGFHGVRLSPDDPAGDWFSNRTLMDPLFTRAGELKIPMCLLFGPNHLDQVVDVVKRHHESVDIVLDHLGSASLERPDTVEKVARLANYPRVYVKVSELWNRSSTKEYPYRDTHGLLRALYDAYGPERLMWGSNWPDVDRHNGVGYAQTLALYRNDIDFLSEADRDWILGLTALELWPFA